VVPSDPVPADSGPTALTGWFHVEQGERISETVMALLASCGVGDSTTVVEVGRYSKGTWSRRSRPEMR
jgi:hypothetical protein